MVTESEMTVEATLSGSAAKLLLHLLRIGAGQRTTAELMRGAGIGNRETYYAAKAQLVEHGLWENPTALFGNPTPLSAFPTPPVGIPDTPDGKVDTPVRLTDTRIYIGTTDPTTAWPPLDTDRVPEDGRNFSEDFEKSALALCQEADRMPADGDPKRPTSEWQARRTAQVKAVCLTWSKLFPEQNPLTTQRAKELLANADNVSEDVYDALQAASGKEYPFGYARTILQGKPKPKAGEVDHTGELMDESPEMRAKTEAAIAKMKKMGLPAYYFGGDE